MADLSDLDQAGVTLNLLDPATFDSGVPHAVVAALRERSPLQWVSEVEGPGYWVALGHPEIVEISTNPSVFSSWAMSCFPRDPRPSDLPEIRQMLLNMDPPQHTGFRRIVSRVFTPRMVRELQGTIEAHARAVVGDLPNEPFNFVRSVGVEMSLRVLADVMGLPQEDRHLLYDWTERLVGDGDTELGGDPVAFGSALMEMFQYADEQTTRKRREPTGDVWSMVANAEVDGEQLTKDELNRFFQLLATAGNETTRTLISAGFLALARHPDQLARVVADPDATVGAAVEEMLRFHAPVMQFRRTALIDAEVAGHRIAAGQKVLLLYPAGNRDPRVFPSPEVFDVGRDPNPHLSFGIGPHFCLGANLARVQARALFSELLRQPFSLELAGDPIAVRSTLIDGYRDISVRKAPQVVP